MRWPSRHADLPFVLLALACGATLLYLGRASTFWHDEWRSITFDGAPLDYLRPVNQHWSTLPLLLYRGTFGVVGLRSYLPYLAEVVVLHLVAVSAAYALMRVRVGPALATLVSIPLLLLGSGAENLFWGFQTGFVGSVALGLWAVFLLERPGPYAAPVASLLLLGSLMSSGMGLFFVVLAAVRTLLDRTLRLRALVAVPPLGLYVVWFAFLGRTQVDDGHLYFELSVVRFVARGLTYATERVSGLGHLPDGHLLGLIAFLALAGLVGYRTVRGPRPALATGCLAGVLTMYVVVAFGRVNADPGYDHATSSRFVYVAAFFLVLAVVDLLPHGAAWASRPRLRLLVPAGLAGALVWATAANVVALGDKRAEFREAANVTRAFVALALQRGSEPWVDRDAPRGWMPTIAELERVVLEHGSPTVDGLVPGVVERPGPAAREAALLSLLGDGFRLEAARRAEEPVDVVVRKAMGVVSTAGGCARAKLAAGNAAWVRGLAPGARVRATWSASVAGRVLLGHHGGPSRPIFADFDAGEATDVVIPDVGDGRPWTLALDAPSGAAELTLCVLRAEADAPASRPRIAVEQWDRSA